MGCPVPINYNFNRLILFTFLPWFISQAMTNSEISACVNKREEGWSALLVEITSFMGAALKSLFGRSHIVLFHFMIRWQLTNTTQNLYFYSLYDFKNLKSSSTWFNPCFPLRRAFLLLLCWVSFPTSFYLRSKH